MSERTMLDVARDRCAGFCSTALYGSRFLAEEAERTLAACDADAVEQIAHLDAQGKQLAQTVDRLTLERDEARASDAESVAAYRSARDRADALRAQVAKLREALEWVKFHTWESDTQRVASDALEATKLHADSQSATGRDGSR